MWRQIDGQQLRLKQWLLVRIPNVSRNPATVPDQQVGQGIVTKEVKALLLKFSDGGLGLVLAFYPEILKAVTRGVGDGVKLHAGIAGSATDLRVRNQRRGAIVDRCPIYRHT